ncbi:unnamed protein product [Cercospora beticola]|nr:unnamed protein product [Cercospora beticola]
MHFSTTSILIASVTILAAANPTPQGLDLVESKFANTQKESCYDIEGGPNGYFCDKYSFLWRCGNGHAEPCQQCGTPTLYNPQTGCFASNDGKAGYCFDGSRQYRNC